jgi:hypothetical protein
LSLVPLEAAAAWRQTRFLVGGWGTGDALRDPERLVRLDGAGIDFVHVMDYDLANGALLLAKLDSLRATGRVRGLEFVLHDPIPPRREESIAKNPAVARNWPAMERRIRMTGDGDALLGWFVWDEPCSRADMDQIGETVRRVIRSGLAERAVPFVNLLAMPEPGAATCYDRDFGAGRSRGDAYATYLDAYLSQYDALPEPAPFLSLDSYPFLMDGREGASYFEALGIARDRAMAHGRAGKRIPLWVTLQLATFRPSRGKWQTSPTAAELAWQVWGAVAYGAKSIAYWTLSPAEDNINHLGFGRGLLGSDGRPSSLYADVRRIDAALHALGPTLMKLDPIAVFHGGRGRQKGIDRELLDNPGRIYGVVSGVAGSGREDCMIGYFKDRTTWTDHLLVVNKSVSRERRFELTLGAAPRSIERFDEGSGRAIAVPPDGTKLVVTLPPASARLYRVALPARETLRGFRSVRKDGTALEYVLESGVLRVNEANGVRSFRAVR